MHEPADLSADLVNAKVRSLLASDQIESVRCELRELGGVPEAGPAAATHRPATAARTHVEQLAARLHEGASLSLHAPSSGQQVSVSTLAELADWAKRHFPVARIER